MSNCTGCPVQQGTYKPAGAVHKIVEPQAKSPERAGALLQALQRAHQTARMAYAEEMQAQRADAKRDKQAGYLIGDLVNQTQEALRLLAFGGAPQAQGNELAAVKVAPAAAEVPDWIEALAESWDGCMYDAPGETIDIGASIRHAALAAPQAQHARDAARWQMALAHTGAENQLGRAHYVIRGIDAPFSVMRGSVAEHFTKSIDAAIAASAKGCQP